MYYSCCDNVPTPAPTRAPTGAPTAAPSEDDDTEYHDATEDEVGFDLDGDGEIRGGGAGEATVAPLSCLDGARNGNETAVDCGGGECPPCADHAACRAHGDCKSGTCCNDAALGAWPEAVATLAGELGVADCAGLVATLHRFGYTCKTGLKALADAGDTGALAGAKAEQVCCASCAAAAGGPGANATRAHTCDATQVAGTWQRSFSACPPEFDLFGEQIDLTEGEDNPEFDSVMLSLYKVCHFTQFYEFWQWDPVAVAAMPHIDLFLDITAPGQAQAEALLDGRASYDPGACSRGDGTEDRNATGRAACLAHGDCRRFAAQQLNDVAGGVEVGDAPAWGKDNHKAVFASQTLGKTPLACLANREVGHGGDDDTVNVGHWGKAPDFPQGEGPSYRQIIDGSALDNPERSVFVNPMGQSGEELSPLYDNMLPSWADGKYYGMSLTSYKTVDAWKVELKP